MNPTAPLTPERMAGQYQLQPGQQPGVLGGRPVLIDGLLTRWLRGQRGEALGRSLSSVFTLCAHAHRRTAELAMSAAQGQASAAQTASTALHLTLETARDHLRSLALDWPQRLPGPAGKRPQLDWLSGCPLSLASGRTVPDAGAALEQLQRLQAWLEQRVLGQSIDAWLSEYSSELALAQWCHRHAEQLPPAYYLWHWYPSASAIKGQAHDLTVLDTDQLRQQAQLTELAAALAQQGDFASYPTWRGACAENGPWNRLRDRPAANTERSAWSRMGARWLELLLLANAPHRAAAAPALLSCGAVHLAPGQAIGWCEMARGLLLHWVQLDQEGAVQDYRVLAPTEWNFHPQGALSQAVSALGPHDQMPASMLAAAFDPCVACTVLEHQGDQS